MQRCQETILVFLRAAPAKRRSQKMATASINPGPTGPAACLRPRRATWIHELSYRKLSYNLLRGNNTLHRWSPIRRDETNLHEPAVGRRLWNFPVYRRGISVLGAQ